MDGRIGPRMDRTRRKVLDAANALLEEVGFGQVTIEDISARSGVARSTLYRHWRTRDDILRDAFSVRAIGPEDTEDSLLPALTTYARAFVHGLEHVWGRAALTLSVSALDDPAQRGVQQVFVEGYRRDVAELVDRAVRRGELDPAVAVDLDAVVLALVAPLFYTFLFGERPVPEAVADAAAARAHALVVGGAASDGAR